MSLTEAREQALGDVRDQLSHTPILRGLYETGRTITGGGGWLFGQNWDWRVEQRAQQILAHNRAMRQANRPDPMAELEAGFGIQGDRMSESLRNRNNLLTEELRLGRGMSDSERELFQLRQQANNGPLRDRLGIQERIARLETETERERDLTRARALTEENLPGSARVRRDWGQNAVLLNRGLIDLETYQRAMLRSIAPYEQRQDRFPTAIFQGAKEDVSTLQALQYQAPQLSLQERIENVLRDQLAVERAILNSLNGNPRVAVANN